MVLEAGIEPACSDERGILSPLCLPIPPLKHDNNIAQLYSAVKHYIKKKCPQEGGGLFIVDDDDASHDVEEAQVACDP